MYIPISGINGVSMTRPQPHHEVHPATAASALSFNETLAAVKAATLDQAERMKRKYRVKVRIQTVSTDGKELGSLGSSGGEQEIVIAPNILQQMAKDPILRNKVYGTIDRCIHEDQASRLQIKQQYAGKSLSSSLIVHKDGTVTVWPTPPSPKATATGQREVAGSRTEEVEAAKPALEGRQAWESALPVLKRNLLSYGDQSLPGSGTLPNPAEGTAVHGLQQIQLMRARRLGKLQ